MSENIKVGVIGVGALGQHHARLYGEAEKGHLVGVYDVDKARANEIAEKFNTKAFYEIHELAAEVDALSVAVPTDLHFDVVSTLLELEKHILVEKPIAANLEQGNKLVALAAKKSQVLQVGHVERFNPVMTYLENVLDNPRFIEAHRLASYPPPRPGLLPRGTEVGVVMDLMIHDIDVILHLVKSDIERIDATGIPILSKSEDIANARIMFKNGCVANMTASRVSPEPMRKIRLFQPDCYLSLDYGDRKGEIYKKTLTGISREEVPIEDHNALEKELEDFLNCVEIAKSTGTVPSPKVTGEHGARALEVASEIVKKVEESSLF